MLEMQKLLGPELTEQTRGVLQLREMLFAGPISYQKEMNSILCEYSVAICMLWLGIALAFSARDILRPASAPHARFHLS
jgi:hypothetical protein